MRAVSAAADKAHSVRRRARPWSGTRMVVSREWLSVAASFDDDVALARDLEPLLVVRAHIGGELRLAEIHHLHAHRAVALAHRLVRHRLPQRGAQFFGDLGRNSSRREDAGEGRRLVALYAEFVERRYFG